VIPKVIHRIWLGRRRIPDQAEHFWQRFAELHPGWELRTWTDADDYSWLANRELFEAAQTWTSRSDVLRFELLARHGGIYVDVDVEPIRSFEPLLTHRAFVGLESPGVMCGAILGSEAAHPAIQALIRSLPGWTKGRPNADPGTWAGPAFLTAQWIGREDIEIFPKEAFYPAHWSQRMRRPSASSYAVHHWAKNWGPVKEPSISIVMAWVDRGDLYRARVRDWVEGYWSSAFPGAEFLIGADHREPFNRSACFNRGAERASGDIIVTIDADCVINPAIVLEGAALVSGKAAWVVPWRSCFRLTEAATLEVLDQEPGGYRSPRIPARGTWDGREPGIGLKFGGFCNVVPREAWELLGGMDERFQGWGSEDIGFSLALDTLWGPHLVPPVDAVHLWHHRPMSRGTMNPALEIAYWQATGRPEEMRKLVGTNGDAPERPGAALPRGWVSSLTLRRRPGQIPPNRVRMLTELAKQAS
jgi:glycosyl transferase-like sugar-binding protein